MTTRQRGSRLTTIRLIALLQILLLAASPSVKAQPIERVWRIAMVFPALRTADEVVNDGTYKSVVSELRQLGYVEGRNLLVDRWAGGGRTGNYADMARQVVHLKPDLIFAVSAPMIFHLKAATPSIPIVAFTGGDPVEQGLVASLARPGANITGFSNLPGREFQGKYLELLRETIPSASRLAFLVPQRLWDGLTAKSLREAAPRFGVTLVPELLGDPIDVLEYRRAFAVIARDRAHAVIIGHYTENIRYRRLIVDLATQTRLPATAFGRAFAEAGGLLSYGAAESDRPRNAAGYIDRILRGAKPGELPYQMPTKFELVINLKTAKALRLTIPPSILLRAEVIE
jgi:putative ABC transport system substrate-binding protein